MQAESIAVLQNAVDFTVIVADSDAGQVLKQGLLSRESAE